MNIGIVAYRQYPYISANTSIAYTIGKYISENTNHKIVYIGRFQDESQNDVKDHDGIPILFFNKTPKNSSSKFVNYTRKVFGENNGYCEEAKELRSIVKNNSIHALICIIAPADDLYIVSNAKLNIPIVLYQLDPFYNVNDVTRPKLKKLFIKFLSDSNIVHVFTTDLLFDEYKKDNDFIKLMNKISVLQFPKLTKDYYVSKTKFETDKRVLLYAGSLYKGIRSPDILINLKKALPQNTELVFCGGCDNSEDMQRLEASGIVCKGYLSPKDLVAQYSRASVLINIGNLVNNQLGSKIIDYIASGKPIINISQIPFCPTLPVLDNYDLKLNLKSDSLEDESVKQQISDFIDDASSKSLSFNEIEDKYCEYTPKYVSEQILAVL